MDELTQRASGPSSSQPTASLNAPPSETLPPDLLQRRARRPRRAPDPERARRNSAILVAVLLLGALLTLLFALRAMRSFRHFQEQRRRPPNETIDAIAPWMTVHWVAVAYDVPPDYIYEQLDIPAEGNDRKPLAALERIYRDGPRGVILDEVRAILEQYYAGSAVPTPILPDPGSVPLPEVPAPGRSPRDGPDAAPEAPVPAAPPAAGDQP